MSLVDETKKAATEGNLQWYELPTADQLISEEELLSTDPEILQLKLNLQHQREKAREEEVHQHEEMCQMDAEIESPLQNIRNKVSLWKDWCATWEVYVDIEDRTLYDQDVLQEKMLWVEDEELGIRQKMETAEDAIFQEEILPLEFQKRRYLLESTAWVSDWEERYTQEWKNERGKSRKALLASQEVVEREQQKERDEVKKCEHMLEKYGVAN